MPLDSISLQFDKSESRPLTLEQELQSKENDRGMKERKQSMFSLYKRKK